MLKNVVLAILTILIVGCSSSVDEADIIIKDGLIYQSSSDKPLSGEVFSSYESGEKEYSVQYENGVKVGEHTFYNKDGSVKEAADMNAILTERDNKFFLSSNNSPYSGKVFALNEKGEKVVEGLLLKGLKEGLWKKTEGDEYNTYTYEQEFANGLQNGISKTFLNGNLIVELNYVDGEKEGLFLEYWLNGQKRHEGQYVHGKKVGVWTDFYESGTKEQEREESINDDIYLVKIIEYYENGNKKEECSKNLNGYYQGEFTSWYESGNIEMKGQHEDNSQYGRRVGEWKFWDDASAQQNDDINSKTSYRFINYYENGRKKEEGFWDAATEKNIGKYASWYENGKKKLEGDYGAAYDDWNAWDENGNPLE